MNVCYFRKSHRFIHILDYGWGCYFSDDIKMVALGDLERYLLQFF